jgi:hypothetical protein
MMAIRIAIGISERDSVCAFSFFGNVPDQFYEGEEKGSSCAQLHGHGFAFVFLHEVWLP